MTTANGSRYRWLFLLLCFTAVTATAQQDISLADEAWYKKAIIYSLDVRTFKDSDGDGIGDFKGLISELDYLQTLGINTIWLAPFQPSPHRDDGYDITDYYGIDTSCGTPGDFAAFLFRCRQRGIRVIMDLVLNHTSDQHPWFLLAQQDTTSPFHDWYYWSTARPRSWNQGMAFPGVQQSTWTYSAQAGQYYFHRFYNFQPHLNFTNAAAKAEAMRVLGYWLNQGIDGFRIDAVPFMIETPRTDTDHSQQHFELIPEMHRYIQWHKGDAVMLGEANVLPGETKHYFGMEENGLNMLFNFYVNQYLFYALASSNVQPLCKALRETKQTSPLSQWVHFLRNHDEVDLGRLTKEQRQLVYNRFGPDTGMQLYNRGIRRRLAPMLHNNRKHIELAYAAVFSLPGSVAVRYGDELGMGDNLALPERLSVRTPMQWTPGEKAGFSTGDTLIRPVIDQPPYSYRQLNVATEKRSDTSLLNWMTRLIRLRTGCSEIGQGNWEITDSARGVLALHYRYQQKELFTVLNFSDQPARTQLPVAAGTRVQELFTGEEQQGGANNRLNIMLDGYGYRWYEVERKPAK
jgi:maltose alpha-D-glucosyltransferase/alpha-amylase